MEYDDAEAQGWGEPEEAQAAAPDGGDGGTTASWPQEAAAGGGSDDAMADLFGHYAENSFPPWKVPGLDDWKAGPAAPPAMPWSDPDPPQTAGDRERERRNQEENPPGERPKVPNEWWSSGKPDLNTPQNPFTPAAQDQLRQKQLQEQLDRARKVREWKQRGPDNRGDFPVPSSDPRLA